MDCADAPVATNMAAAARAHCAAFMDITPLGVTLTLIPKLWNPLSFGWATFGSDSGEDNAVPFGATGIGGCFRRSLAAVVFARRRRNPAFINNGDETNRGPRQGS